MRNVKQSGKSLFRAPVRGGLAALLGLVGIGVCFSVFILDLQLISEIDINGLILSFVLCGLGAGLGIILLYRLFPGRPPVSLFGKIGVQIQDPILIETPSRAVREGSTAIEPTSTSWSLAVPGDNHPPKASRYKMPENSAIFSFISIILMTAALSSRVPLGRNFVCLSLLAGGALALTFYWLRWRGRGSNNLHSAIPVAGGVVASAAMIGLGVVMMRFSFLRVFLELVLVAGVVIAAGLQWLHSHDRDTSLV
jgi:hypothetical protein